MKKARRLDREDLSDEGLRLRDLVKSVADDTRRIRKLALLDKLAVALILDCRQLLPDGEFADGLGAM